MIGSASGGFGKGVNTCNQPIKKKNKTEYTHRQFLSVVTAMSENSIAPFGTLTLFYGSKDHE